MDGQRKRERGLTLVELIVVLAMVALLTAIAIPGMARLGAFSDDSLPRASRDLFEMLSAARVYATTWNVRTAVVYNLEGYQSPLQNPNNDPLPATAYPTDSVTGGTSRFISSASLMYELPGSNVNFREAIAAVIPNDIQSAFVPFLGEEGQWKEWEDGVSVLLMNPDLVNNAGYTGERNTYTGLAPRFDVSADNFTSGVSALGMYRGIPVILDYEKLFDSRNAGEPAQAQAQYIARFAAHVFLPDGRLQTLGTKERYTFYLGYRPDEVLDQRLNNADVPQLFYVDPDTGEEVLNLRVIPMEIYRSTGRVKIAS